MPSTSLAYRLAMSAMVPLVPRLLRDPRQRAAHAARLAAVEQLVAWGKRRDGARPLAWFHAPSVGEGLQAEAVINAFRLAHPEMLLVYTHYSPSAVDLAARLPVDWHGYLPYDRRRDVVPILDALRPDLLVFTKLDLWPELACQAWHRGVAVTMVAGTVQPESSRLRWPARELLRPGYRTLTDVSAIAIHDAERLKQLGVPTTSLHIVGDPRMDSVIDRLEALRPTTPPVNAARTLVAGSTWPADETVVLNAYRQVRRDHPDARLVLAPHDPTELHLQSIERLAATLGLAAPVRWSAAEDTDALPPFVLIDRTGLLAGLYQTGGFAYVGGGFGGDGIHSVLEPAAAALPVVIGPKDRGSRDAELLERAGGLLRLSPAGAEHELAARWSQWLNAPAEMISAGASARRVVLAERGAAQRSVEWLERALEHRAERPTT